MPYFDDKLDLKIFKLINEYPSIRSKDNVVVIVHFDEPKYLSISVDIYYPVEYGEGDNVVFLERQFINDISEFENLFKVKDTNDVEEIKKVQLWSFFLSGECDLVCIVKGCLYRFKVIGGLDGNSLEFDRGDIGFVPLVLPRKKFPNVGAYWNYVWEYHEKNPYPV